ncbi:hypothetical protein UFOVP1229_80 [uncultured Caudovirales phage]|uniref:Uncharacterized protein n=1 Tax=uncultured Caudovirales phage TaxID=2100421 RepID=A0A6J5R427_9CAUD|nr:hypothetical protein UFOVP1229_80 [uncultured Caudovirales phage]
MITIQCVCQWLVVGLLLFTFSGTTAKDFKTAATKGYNAGISEFCFSVAGSLVVWILLYGAGTFSVLFGDRSF